MELEENKKLINSIGVELYFKAVDQQSTTKMF